MPDHDRMTSVRTFPECDFSFLAFQVDALAAGNDDLGRALAMQFDPSSHPGWFEEHRARVKHLLKLAPELEPRARSLATSWLGLRGDDAHVAPNSLAGTAGLTSADITHGEHANVELERRLLSHFMAQLGAQRAFLGLLSPLSNEFEISVSIPPFPEDVLGREASNKSLIGLVTNWKCPYVAPDAEGSRSQLAGWWRSTPEWGVAHSVLCVPLLVLNYWPDGTPFPYPIGSLYFESDARSHFTEHHLALMTLVSSIVAPWLLSYRRALGLASFKAVARYARNDPPRDWPGTLSRALGRALHEMRTANCAFVLRSGVYSEDERVPSELLPAIDALVGVDKLQQVDADQLARLRDVFQLSDRQQSSLTDQRVLDECRNLASALALAATPGTTRKARELALQHAHSRSASGSAQATWDCARNHKDSVPFFRSVTSTVSIAHHYPGNPGTKPIVVSLTAECSAIRFDDHAGHRQTDSHLTLDQLREVGAQGWLREPYFLGSEEVQYLQAVATKLSEFVQRRRSGSGYQHAALFDFIPLTADFAQRVEISVKHAKSVALDRQRTPVILIRGATGEGKTTLARAIHRDTNLLANATEPVLLDRQMRSRIVAMQSCRQAAQQGVCVALVDDAHLLDDAALGNLLRVLSAPTVLPDAIIVITYRRTHDSSSTVSTAPSVVDLLECMRAIDPSSVNRAQLKVLLESSAVEALELPSFVSLSEEQRLEVIRLGVELEKDAYSRHWRAPSSRPLDFVEGPNEAALRAMLSYKEATSDVAGIREFARRWIHLSELKQHGHLQNVANRRVYLDGQDLGTVCRVLNGGSTFFAQDFQRDLEALERDVFAKSGDNSRYTEALRWSFRALVDLHFEQPHVSGFELSEIEAVVKRRRKEADSPSVNAVRVALTTPQLMLFGPDSKEVIVRTGKTKDRKYTLSKNALERLALQVARTDTPPAQH
jgi:hypothetical protein